MMTAKAKASNGHGGNGKTHHPDNMENVTAELLTEMNMLQAVLSSTQENLEKSKTDLETSHRLLDAAGIPEAATMRDRLVWIAKEWFAHHPIGCQDHISPGMRRLLREAGEQAWMDAKG